MVWNSIKPGDRVTVKGKNAGEKYTGLTLIEVTDKFIHCRKGDQEQTFPRGRGYIVEKA